MLEEFENQITKQMSEVATSSDPAHDMLHLKRVVAMAKYLCREERARMEVVVPAAWFHDCVVIPKDDPRRKEASRLSARSAIEHLKSISYPETYFDQIAHAIEAHSFSAGVKARTLEAMIVQDADRLDGLGAIGVARCFATSGLMRRTFYFEADPLCQNRFPDDGRFTVDHFFAKLFQTAEMLNTASARTEGIRRVQTMKRFLVDLEHEISIRDLSSGLDKI